MEWDFSYGKGAPYTAAAFASHIGILDNGHVVVLGSSSLQDVCEPALPWLVTLDAATGAPECATYFYQPRFPYEPRELAVGGGNVWLGGSANGSFTIGGVEYVGTGSAASYVAKFLIDPKP